MGLLLMHKKTRVSIWNDLVSFSPDVPHDPPLGGKRGDVTVFSQASRYRLFRLLHQLEFEKVSFITLTYPASFPEDPKVYKGHLLAFRQMIERRYGKIKTVWRLEFQERGAPHYHLMMLDAPFIPVEELCWEWKCIVGSYDMAHELLGVDIKLVTGHKEGALIASYLAKYVGKIDDRDTKDVTQKVGRWWGKWWIKEPEAIEIEIDAGLVNHAMARILDSRGDTGAWQPTNRECFTLFGDTLGTGKFGWTVYKILQSEKKLFEGD